MTAAYVNCVFRILTNPESRTFESGKSVVKFLAGMDGGKDKFGQYIRNSIEVQAWGNDGRVVQDYCQKGGYVFVNGVLLTDVWTDKNGVEQRRLYVQAVRVDLMPKDFAANDSAIAPLEEALPF